MATSPYAPGPHPLKKGKAVKEKNLQPPLILPELLNYLSPSPFVALIWRVYAPFMPYHLREDGFFSFLSPDPV
jgi:hypothetical protein